ncbi:MAG TPA: sugar phosphate isomerase/epimerase family protein [Planctomycetaceae bacterium]|nr:sugar phosphate isomerase/epimerase family protein [Planctomycetaceae bacterium]
MMRLSVNHLTTFACELDDELVAYHREGLRAIGLWRPKLSSFGEERAAEFLRELGISVSSLSWAGGFTGANRWSFEDSLADARAAIKAAAMVGAECLSVVSGPQNGHIDSHARRLITHALRDLEPEATEAGVTLALQPMREEFSSGWTFLHELDEALAIIADSSQRVKLAFDVYHLWNQRRLIARIPEFAAQVALVQLCDSRTGARGDRRMLGEGEVPISEIVQAFDEAGYAGYYELAAWSRPLWRRDLCELLRECRARFDSLCRRPDPAAVADN